MSFIQCVPARVTPAFNPCTTLGPGSACTSLSTSSSYTVLASQPLHSASSGYSPPATTLGAGGAAPSATAKDPKNDEVNAIVKTMSDGPDVVNPWWPVMPVLAVLLGVALYWDRPLRAVWRRVNSLPSGPQGREQEHSFAVWKDWRDYGTVPVLFIAIYMSLRHDMSRPASTYLLELVALSKVAVGTVKMVKGGVQGVWKGGQRLKGRWQARQNAEQDAALDDEVTPQPSVSTPPEAPTEPPADY